MFIRCAQQVLVFLCRHKISENTRRLAVSPCRQPCIQYSDVRFLVGHENIDGEMQKDRIRARKSNNKHSEQSYRDTQTDTKWTSGRGHRNYTSQILLLYISTDKSCLGHPGAEPSHDDPHDWCPRNLSCSHGILNELISGRRERETYARTAMYAFDNCT